MSEWYKKEREECNISYYTPKVIMGKLRERINDSKDNKVKPKIH